MSVVIPGRDWIGGVKYTRCQQQFQLLFQRYGYKQARNLADEMIIWPDDRRPPDHIYLSWAIAIDEGNVEIPEKIERAFTKRLDGMVKSAAEMTVIENARTARALAVQAREGTLDPSRASMYMHANNGTGFIYREIIGQNGKRQADFVPQTNFFINAGKPPKKKLGAGRPGLIEASFKELPVGERPQAS